jgi:general secretion pathway protein D
LNQEATVRRPFHAAFRPGFALPVVLAFSVSACQTTDGPAPLNDWVRAQSARTGDDGKAAAAQARLAARPGDRQDPTSAQSIIEPGTGKLIGAAARRKSAAPDGDEDGVTVNLVNAPIDQAAKTVLGDILGLNYSVNPRVDAKITIQTSTPVSRSELIDLFQSSLRAGGAAIVRNGTIYQIETADLAPKNVPELDVEPAPNDVNSIGSTTRVIQLKYVNAFEMRRILDPIVPKGAIARADDVRNTLTLAGNKSDLAAMLDAISIFDVDVMKGMSVALVPVRSGAADALVEDLKAIFGTDREGPLSGMIRFIPNQRLKSILVISPQRSYMVRAERAIRRLDAKAQGPEKQLFTYVARNRSAKELLTIVDSIFFASSRNAAQSGGNVAPRYQEAMIQSAQTAGSASSLAGASAAGGAGAGLAGQAAAALPGSGMQGESQNANPASPADQPGENERIRLSVDDSNNALLIFASRPDYQRILRIAESLDIIPNQVMIEATIAEVSLNDDLKFGVRWFIEGKRNNYSLTDAGAAAFGSVFPGFSYALAAANVQFTLNALNTITHVNVISSPSLTVVNNRTATLQIGDQVPVVTQSAIGVSAAAAPIVNSVNYRDTGVILSITPRINESGRVLLNIEQEVSSVATTTTSNIDSPTIKQRRVKTTVVVNDGESLALGGLIQDQVSDGRNQLPVLGDIPLFGSAFRQKGGAVNKTELVVFITPRVVRNLDQAAEITDEYRRKFNLRMTGARATGNSVDGTVRRILD